VPLCPPQTPHAARTRTRAVGVGRQRLTASATAGPLIVRDYLLMKEFNDQYMQLPTRTRSLFTITCPSCSSDMNIVVNTSYNNNNNINVIITPSCNSDTNVILKFSYESSPTENFVHLCRSSTFLLTRLLLSARALYGHFH
jgi:hypothetical protein